MSKMEIPELSIYSTLVDTTLSTRFDTVIGPLHSYTHLEFTRKFIDISRLKYVQHPEARAHLSPNIIPATVEVAAATWEGSQTVFNELEPSFLNLFR